MCGIIGQLTFPSAEAGSHKEATLLGLLSLMARRGPDDEGLWSDRQYCTLGFRRLAILDLSASGHQPMLTQDERYALVYNGEVYNFRSLRQELEKEGVRFRSTGDTEVVLYALARWGEEALSRFNGMFALGFYDSREKRLLLARDHAGIKPLYYIQTSQGVFFASQYDQILAHPWGQKAEISPSALGLYLRLGYIPAPYALLQKSYMLEPGSWLESTSEHQVRRGRFFEFPVYQEPDLFGAEAYEAVDAAVTAAVRRQLISDVPVGTFLSGGIDSPLVTAKARIATPDMLKAFTIGTNGDHLDESPDAVAYAREIGVEHIVEHVTPNQSLDMLDDVVAACGEPLADYSIFPTMLVSQLARQQVKVVLSGDGGDELFWGYAGRFALALELTSDLDQYLEKPKARQRVNKFLAVAAKLQDPRLPTNVGDFYRVKHSLSEGWLHQLLPDLPPWPPDFSLFTYSGWEVTPAAQWLRWNEFRGHLTRVLLKVDRASMFRSLEVRVPLLDREVIATALRIDWRSCLDIAQQVGKLPLRHALARHVHRQTWAKRGFDIPMAAWLRSPLRPVFEDIVLTRKEILGLPLNTKMVQRMFDRHLAAQAHYERELWTLLSLTLWEERHYRTK